MTRRKLECEKCGERLELALPSARAWHASCKAKGPRSALPRYVPLNAQASDSAL